MSTKGPCFQDNFQDAQFQPSTSASSFSKRHKKPSLSRVFVNRSLNFGKIKYFGFDMDYTLAVYKSPQYEELGYDLARDRLIEMGYPAEIKDFKYDPNFVLRGLIYDKELGYLLKVDTYGNILTCAQGFRFLKISEVNDQYPNKFIQLGDTKRYFIYNTLFNLPEIYLQACVIDYFCQSPLFIKKKNGVQKGDMLMTYATMHTDIRSAVDHIHIQGSLKQRTVENLEKYVVKEPKLPLLLDRMSEHGKVFLVTNSEYQYTNAVMTYLFDFPSTNNETHRPWTSYFSYVIVDAKKPLFFGGGTSLRQVDTVTGNLKIGHCTGGIEKGAIYSGGSSDILCDVMNAKGREILYIGDHIFGDILKSKKRCGWRTFLVVPEISQEMSVWNQKKDLYNKLNELYDKISDMYSELDSASQEIPSLFNLKDQTRTVIHEMDTAFGVFGSLFRNGSRQTFFASQVMRYADLYASSFINLLHYPFCNFFKAAAVLMPHELTSFDNEVSHEFESPMANREHIETDLVNTACGPSHQMTMSTESLRFNEDVEDSDD